MGVLRVLLTLVEVRLFRAILRTIARLDHGTHFIQRVGGNARRIGTHVGDQTDGAFFRTELHAFVQLLRQHHGALHTKAQLTSGLLLQGRGNERRNRVAALLAIDDRLDHIVGPFQRIDNGLRSGLVGNFNVLAILLGEMRVELRRLLRAERGVDGPILLLDERSDLAFAVDDHAQGNRLHATRR